MASMAMDFSDSAKLVRLRFILAIFCGSFLGPDDTMASAQYNADDYWPHVCVFEEQQVSALLANYEVLRFQVYKRSGITPVGEPHDWHLFSVVARKTPVNAR